MLVGNRPLLRVGPFIIARRYSYTLIRPNLVAAHLVAPLTFSR